MRTFWRIYYLFYDRWIELQLWWHWRKFKKELADINAEVDEMVAWYDARDAADRHGSYEIEPYDSEGRY